MSLASELRAAIIRHVERASLEEILPFAAAVCSNEGERSADVPGLIPRAAMAEGSVQLGSDQDWIRFERAGDIVVDREFGLEWTHSSVGASRLNWQAANDACEALELDGGGWRLPTIKELLSLVDYERHDPAIDPAFECESSWYWTSTPYAPSPGDCAWFVDFDGGNANCYVRDFVGFVRAVRGGQS